MCLAIPGQVETIDMHGHMATVDVLGVKRQVNVSLLKEQGLSIGDWVLIHVGFAMSKISSDQAKEQIQLLEMLGEASEAMNEVRGYAFSSEDVRSREEYHGPQTS